MTLTNTGNKLKSKELPKAPKQKFFPLSFQQRRVYFIARLNPEGSAMRNCFDIDEKGTDINIDALNKAYRQMVKRYASLRTRIILKGNEPFQLIQKKLKPKVDVIDLTQTDDKNRKSEAQNIIQEEINKPFDLTIAPLCRVLVVKVTENKNILFINMHHIISDAASVGIFKNEINTLYEAYNNNVKAELPKLKREYHEYCYWQRNSYELNELPGMETFWLEQFKDIDSVQDIPVDYPRKEFRSFAGKSMGKKIEKELILKINDLCRNRVLTNFTYYLTSLALLLNNYTSQQDIVIGSPFQGRDRFHDLKGMIGFFINTIPFRIIIDPDKSFLQLLKQVQKQLMYSFRNQEYPIENLVKKLKIDRSLNRNPLFDVFINYLPGEEKNENITYEENIIQDETRMLEYDLSFNIIHHPETAYVRVDYLEDLFKADTIDRMIAHYIKILSVIASSPDAKVSTLSILPDEEKKYLIEDLNQTATDYPSDKMIHELFEEQVLETPDEAAVFFRDDHITYRELNNKANQLALFLRQKQLQPDSVIGIMMERSFDMMIAILGILKAGCAYLPLDPGYPSDRINFIIQDAEMKLLLVSGAKPSSLNIPDILDLSSYNYTEENVPNPDNINSSGNIAYVIYTSGSTGLPKGVMIEHHSVVNRLNWMQKKYGLQINDKLMQKTPYTFDVSVWELLWWSFTGAKTCFLDPGGEKDPKVIVDGISKWKISVIHFVPSMLTIFLEYLKANRDQVDKIKSLRLVITSGEALGYHCVTDFDEIIHQKNGTGLSNLYGPTECTIDVTYFDVLPGEYDMRIPIGKPIDNTQAYILNENLNPVPVGVKGELYISGVNLARGYLNRDDLTKERFIDNPFIKGSKMYRTGDVARYLPDGNIDYISRTDHQVKIRGNRVELGEIENTLRKHDMIKDCKLIVKEFKNNDVRLIAFVIVNERISTLKLRSYLREFLPDYMVPSRFIQMEKFPLNSNGKLDQKALEKHIQDADIERNETILPKTDLQKELAEIWKKEIGVDSISLNDNFFDIGGHSLLILNVTHRLEEKYGKSPRFRDFFNKTFEQFVETFEQTGAN